VTLDLGFGDIRSYPPSEYSGVVVFRLDQQDKANIEACAGVSSQHSTTRSSRGHFGSSSRIRCEFAGRTLPTNTGREHIELEWTAPSLREGMKYFEGGCTSAARSWRRREFALREKPGVGPRKKPLFSGFLHAPRTWIDGLGCSRRRSHGSPLPRNYSGSAGAAWEVFWCAPPGTLRARRR
jgi:hypothetical protein